MGWGASDIDPAGEAVVMGHKSHGKRGPTNRAGPPFFHILAI